MRNAGQPIFIALLLSCLLGPFDANAKNLSAASCSRADVTTAYNAASDGDTIIIPTGDCQAANKWSSSLDITKKVTIQGAGAGSTMIGISTGTPVFEIKSDNVAVTGITFNCNYQNTSTTGIIFIGEYSTCPTASYKDWRVHHNTFDNCGGANGDVTGYSAIAIAGFSYGLIDQNTFNDCNGECLDVSMDGVAGWSRSNEFGRYTNGTLFIEDNTFNVTRPGIYYENVVDGNSAQRFTFRHNTINVVDGGSINSGVVSTHETCVLSTGSSSNCGDAGSAAYEMYNNTINLNATGKMRDLGIVRGGRALIYNNRIIGTGDMSGRYHVASWLSNYRSFAAYGGIPTWCSAATHARGYTGSCHEVDGSYIAEGLERAKTTLTGAINSSQTTITLASTAGFSANGVANGFSILIDNEQIDYMGISGNQLTGCTRAANHTTAASHSNGARVDYLKFGVCLEQVNNVYIWGNQINGVVGSAMNDVYICGYYPGGGMQCAGEGGPDYTAYDIKSYAERPNNWQYRTGSAYSYTPYPYPYPHPLRTGLSAPSPPLNLRIPN